MNPVPPAMINNPGLDPSIECPMCHSRSWAIHLHRVQCCRCGLCYAVPNICLMQTTLIPQSIPSKEVVAALKILDGPE